jgi:MarR family transcriptional regulator for hemolysin
VVLTEEGRAVTAKMEEELVTLRAQALKDVSRSDLEATLRVLAAFTGEVSEPADESSNPGNEPGNQGREEPDERASRARAPAGGRVRHAAKANKSNKGKADTAAPQEAGDPA